MRSTQTVLVLESHARAAVGIVRSLLRRGIDVISASDYHYCASRFVRGLKKHIKYPAINSSPQYFIEWLLSYLETHPTGILLPLGDVCVELIAKYQKEIREHTVLFMPEYEHFIIAYDKIKSNKAAESAGIPIPRSWYPDEEGLDTVLKSASFPVLIKPSIGVGARGIIQINSPLELEKEWVRAQAPNKRMFVQELIPVPSRQYVIDLLMDKQFRTIASVVSEKIRLFPVKGGASTLSRSVNRPNLSENAAKLLRSIGYYGISNIDLIEDSCDGQVKFIEVNPRFGEMHAICGAVGVDLPFLYCCLANGEKLSGTQPYPAGKYFRFLPTDLVWFLHSPERFRAVPGFWKSFGGKVEHTLFADGDYGPLLGYALENLMLLSNPKKLFYRFSR